MARKQTLSVRVTIHRVFWVGRASVWPDEPKDPLIELPMPLHPQAQAFVDSLAEQPPPGWEEMSIQQARETFESFAPFLGDHTPLVRVEDHTTTDGIALRLYSNADGVRPLVMFFHGGGFVLGDLESHDALCRRIAKETDCTVVAVQYGCSPENRSPGPLNDCYSALLHVVENADTFKVDPEKLAVVGDSAGGNLAATVALKSRDEAGPHIALQVLIYPVVEPNFDTESYLQFASGFGLTRSNMQWFWKQLLGEQEVSALEAPSLASSHAGLPPALVVTAEYDVLRDEGEAYAEKLSAAGVEVTMKRYDGALHGFVHFAGLFDTGLEATTDICTFIRESLA